MFCKEVMCSYIDVWCGFVPVTDGVFGTAGPKASSDRVAVYLQLFAVALPTYREAADVVGHGCFVFNSLGATV